MDLASVHGQVQATEDGLVAGPHMQVTDLQVGHQATTDGVSSNRRENSTSSASVVFCNDRTIPPCTRVHSSLVAQPCPWSGSCEHSTRSVWSWRKHSIGAIEPSSAWTTSSIEISSAGRASQ